MSARTNQSPKHIQLLRYGRESSEFIGVGHANGRCLEDECKRLCHEEMRERTKRDLRTPHDPLRHGPIADATNAIVTLIHHQI